MQERIDTDDLKRQYDLVSFIQRDLGQDGRNGPTYVSFRCPFHEDKHPSFIVNKEKQYCVCKSQGCVACEKPMDIIAYIQMRQNVDFKEAITILDGKRPLRPPNPRPKQEKRKVVNFLDSVRQLKGYQHEAIPYFVSRHILQYIIERDLFSVDRLIYEKSAYVMNGKRYAFTAPRFIIPDFQFNRIRSVNCRRNDSRIRRIVEANRAIFDEIQIDIAEKDGLTSLPSMDEVVDTVFGSKYIFWTNSSPRLYNSNRVVSFMNGKLFYPRLNTLIVVESEVDAQALESATEKAGYAAVAAKGSAGLNQAFKNVERLVVVAENDPVKHRYDGSYGIPGEDFADRIRDASQHPHVKVIFPPDGCKDANDAVVSGKVFDWMESEKVPLMERELLDRTIEMARSV